MSPDHSDEDQGLEELEHLVKIDRVEFLLLIKTLSYILKRTSNFLMKPTKLQSELKEKLLLHDAKVEKIMQIWVKNMKPLMDNLEGAADGDACGDQFGNNELESAAWAVKVQLSSKVQQKEKTVLGQLQLVTSRGEPTVLEMNHLELSHLYNQLELIQNEMDAFRSK